MIALELLGTVYNGVAEAVVKSNFEFLYIFAIFYPNPNQVYRSVSSFKSFKKVEFNCSTISARDLLICFWLDRSYSVFGSGIRTLILAIIVSHLV
jgi:hypothetical protein